MTSTLKQRCVCQCWNLQRWITLNQRCLFQHWFGQRYTTSKQHCHFQRRFSQCWATLKQRCEYYLLKKKIKPQTKLYFWAGKNTLDSRIRWIFNRSLLKKKIETKGSCKFDKIVKENLWEFHEAWKYGHQILCIVHKDKIVNQRRYWMVWKSSLCR